MSTHLGTVHTRVRVACSFKDEVRLCDWCAMLSDDRQHPPPPVSEGGFHQNQRVQAPCRSACKRAEGASEASSDLWR